MSHPATEALKILERRKSVQDLWLRGKMQWEIARDVNVSRRTVCRDLATILEMGLERLKDKREEWIWEEVAKLNRWESEANEAWERSKLDAEIRQAKTVQTADVQRTEASRREVGQCRDPRYLTEARGCAKQRCELLGLLVHRREHSESDGKPLGWNLAKALELFALTDAHDRARGLLEGPAPETQETSP
jgi:hypothetical protein